MRSSKRLFGNERGVSLIFGTAALAFFIIPMVGLAVDVGLLYMNKAKLQGAVDGASLAAARALSLGANTAAQTASAQQNATNWFNANFQTGTGLTSSTVLATPSVYDDTSGAIGSAQIRHVAVTASTNVPTLFLRWLPSAVNFTTITASGNASRRDAVIMMVLDRSGSMGPACPFMKSAAKTFTGQFAAGRDQIGMVTFADTSILVSPPTTNFQTVLGYTDSGGVGHPGAIDGIACNGTTGTPQAISMAYNELYNINLPGALNVLFFETDGLPNTVTIQTNYPFGIGGSQAVPHSPYPLTALKPTSLCQDSRTPTSSPIDPADPSPPSPNTAQTMVQDLANVNGLGVRNWTDYPPNWTPGFNYSSYAHTFFPTIPGGAIMNISTNDPPGATAINGVGNKYLGFAPNNPNSGRVANSGGCNFTAGGSDLAWVPPTDVFGNRFATGYRTPVTLYNADGRVAVDGPSIHNAAFNASDDAGFTARSNAAIPAFVFAVGMSSADHPFMQKLANDGTADLPLYGPQTFPTQTSQPHGRYIYANTASQLGNAFLTISSLILRLGQ